MGDWKERQREEIGTLEIEEKKGPNLYAAIAAAAAVLALALVLLTVFAVKAHNDKKALREQLSEAERKLELREDAFAALEAKQREQASKLEELLSIEEPDPVITTDQIEERIDSVRELVVKDYIYRNAARREASKTWLWGWTMPFSDTSLLVIYDGTIKYGLDLQKVKVTVDEDRRAVTVALPDSRVISHEIPPESIQVLEVKNNLFNEVTFDDYNTFIAEEKTVMEAAAVERGLIEQANSEAKAVIRDALSLLPGMDTYRLTVN